MKKFIVKIADKTYKVEANDAEHATKLVKIACKDARRINYDDDIIKVTLNGKEVFKGYAEDWIDDDFYSEFKWTGSQYEASNAKGRWVVRVIDSVKDDQQIIKDTIVKKIIVSDSVNENDLEKAILKLPKDALQEIAYPGLRGPVGCSKYELQDDVINGAGFDALLKGNKSHPEAKRIIEELNDRHIKVKGVTDSLKDNIKVGQRVKWDTTDAHGQKFAGEGVVIEAKNFAGMIVVKYDRTKYPEMYRAPYNGTAVVKESNARVIDSLKDDQQIIKDTIVARYKGAKIEKVNSSSKPYMIVGFGEAYSSIDEAKRAVDEWIDQGIRFRDAASPLQTVNALLEDERAAVDAYNVALENLKGKIPDESYEAIEAIRNDENRHIENLQAVVNGNVTEKNLEDAVKNNLDVYRSAIKEAVDELQKINGKYNEQDKVLVQSVLQKATAAIARAKSNYEKWI